MRRALVRAAAVVGCIVWSARSLGCDPASTTGGIVDTDGDGLSDVDEIALYGTSPVLADTDGDGMSDYQEIVLHAFDPVNAPLRFNPRVADLPEMEVQIPGPPLISVHLTDLTGETRSFEVARETEVVDAVSQGTTETVTGSDTVGETDIVSREVSGQTNLSSAVPRDAGAGGEKRDDEDEDEEADDGPILVTLTNGASTALDRSSTTEVSLSFGVELSRQIRELLASAESYAQTHEIAASDGVLEVLARIINRGNLPFRVTNLILAASLVVGDGVEVPVGNLHIDTLTLSQFQPFAAAPGERLGPVNFSRDSLTLDQISSLLPDARGLMVRVGVYELSGETGKPYTFDSATVRSRTATVAIDYAGRRRPERHLVATNLDPARPGVTVKRALNEILKLPVECAPDAGVTAVRDVAPDGNESGRWCLRHRRHDDGDDATPSCVDVATYDCSTDLLRAGDVLYLTWIQP